MRVILWGELYWPYIGGAELFASDLLHALRERGYECAVVTSHDDLVLPDEDSFQNVPIYRFNFRRALQPAHVEEFLALRRRVATFLRAWAPDLIHVNGVTPSTFYCVHTLRTDPVPLLVRLNRELLPHQSAQTRGSVLEHTLRRANWVIGASAAILAEARTLVPDIATRSAVIYNGVATPALPPPAAAEARILCLGRLVTDKGFDIAIDAFAAQRGAHPDARLIIAGDGPERTALQARAHARGVADAVEFLGWVAPADVTQLIASACIVLMPSREDGMPNVALQASAQAVPIIGSGTGGLPEAIQHGETGLIVASDATAIAAALATLLADRPAARRMGLAGWQRARAMFDQQRCVDAYDALYRRLAGVPA